MKKTGLVTAAMLAVAGRAIEEGVFVSAGIGLNKDTGKVERHFYITTWQNRSNPRHIPVVHPSRVVYQRGNVENY